MSSFQYKNETLHCENVSLKQIAEEVGTPFYVYSANGLRKRFREFDNAFEGMDRIVCYAVKACGNIGVLALLGSEGSGADIVSGGELHRALKAGMDKNKIVFAGVGKTEEEIKFGISSDILMFNAESRQEIDLINKCAGEMNATARIAIRVNPDVDAKTHPYISTGLKKNKFGIPVDKAKEDYIYASSLPNIEAVGIHCHIGSQLTEISPFRDAAAILVKLIKDLRKNGVNIKYLDLGGGLGITYHDEHAPSHKEYAEAIKEVIRDEDFTLVFEPGRNISGNAGALVTKVLYTKETEEKSFKIVDAAMNDLARPSLYNAYHEVQAVDSTEKMFTGDIVGPICESSDFLAKDRNMPNVKRGGLYAVMDTGAYGMTMASNYNSRPRVPEILVDGENYHIVRRRETYDDLTGPEGIPKYLRTK
ncbi:diaminopimelate decarboxylase [Denitrovibrio acetiphilus DSM 12809]|uniref:Diaminopimelate decarboxylase n=1 Tax=Denitrovibrio acetiphilus (strain DSM 12809 / NBRC 114555 / N2460) TaxID=522772 RepID=D4H4C0_DENA2|nr:diaminopimelate decarboxylase [Denitrovibrio acetiphilus]ADD69249.1 diaminopimelate decarboxylase [Denitrovibrio acetiphilus DSM 12809]